MSGKFERDMVGAASIVALLFAGDNPAVAEAAEHIRRKVGVGMAGGEEPEPEDDGNTITIDSKGRVQEPNAKSGLRLFAVFLPDGAYSGRAFLSPHQAATYADSLKSAAYIRKMCADDLPEE